LWIFGPKVPATVLTAFQTTLFHIFQYFFVPTNSITYYPFRKKFILVSTLAPWMPPI
jgi:hypothetical protein